ncbi:uncharacterized protein MYCFIDRAFT_179533 [Pseudocercospora fijiensis CIRAD86]|uniref:Uncharacterized protein n=1 Tax=Pseudocercospora fijiensis (strain CIRAD86) TaxID=383855 RepID=M2ZG21_PSEFD|nr:uncharacterized protein MYCFIDRAFT_179533 [Pseudocercospora fijiensis CIRAD86]EME78094.1 hypothetical protein MYCFIDRAFT_179533 [Pseudocercospora fijiensis CIRAD86]
MCIEILDSACLYAVLLIRDTSRAEHEHMWLKWLAALNGLNGVGEREAIPRVRHVSMIVATVDVDLLLGRVAAESPCFWLILFKWDGLNYCRSYTCILLMLWVDEKSIAFEEYACAYFLTMRCIWADLEAGKSTHPRTNETLVAQLRDRYAHPENSTSAAEAAFGVKFSESIWYGRRPTQQGQNLPETL